jgi:hypothetical protein
MGGQEFFLAWWVLHPVATGSTSLAPPGEPPEHQRWLLVSLRPDWSKHRTNRNPASDRDSQITTGNQKPQEKTHARVRGIHPFCNRNRSMIAWRPPVAGGLAQDFALETDPAVVPNKNEGFYLQGAVLAIDTDSSLRNTYLDDSQS